MSFQPSSPKPHCKRLCCIMEDRTAQTKDEYINPSSTFRCHISLQTPPRCPTSPNTLNYKTLALTLPYSILPLSLSLEPLQVFLPHTTLSTSFALSNATAANSCPTVTATVESHSCHERFLACADHILERTTTVPCGCPATAPTTAVTKCIGCVYTG